MIEYTLVKTLDLPHGQRWALFLDANVVVLSSCLDDEGRERALHEVCDYWWKTCLQEVPTPPRPLAVAG